MAALLNDKKHRLWRIKGFLNYSMIGRSLLWVAYKPRSQILTKFIIVILQGKNIPKQQ
ncbi:MAG: hypothetical protein K0S08_1965 [Gammaproteobacteria bacterium]|jgi:hypothetical protein|nr:hypothetical protein [Gammaproteobacteria bacterium]